MVGLPLVLFLAFIGALAVLWTACWGIVALSMWAHGSPATMPDVLATGAYGVAAIVVTVCLTALVSTALMMRRRRP